MGFIQQLYEQSFPLEERRLFTAVQEKLAAGDMRLELAVTEANSPVGFVIYWLFEQFLFIEHLAIDAACRSKGYGEKIMQLLLERTTACCLLEVEHPHDLYSEKRIGFYNRLGFAANDIAYFQPAYHPGGEPLPLLLLSKPVLSPAELDQFTRQVHTTVYNISETDERVND